MTFKRYVTPLQPRTLGPYDRLLVDPTTGNPLGIQNPNANGDDGYFYPVVITAAQQADPPAEMLANLNVTYRLDTAPYTRYVSDGSALVELGFVPGSTFSQQIIYAPWTVLSRVALYDETRVYAWPT